MKYIVSVSAKRTDYFDLGLGKRDYSEKMEISASAQFIVDSDNEEGARAEALQKLLNNTPIEDGWTAHECVSKEFHGHCKMYGKFGRLV